MTTKLDKKQEATSTPHAADDNDLRAIPVRSYVRTNRELATAFDRYLLARGFASSTRKSYGTCVHGFVDFLRGISVAEADRSVIREFLGRLCSRGLDEKTIRRQTASLRCFFRFLQLSGQTRRDPTLMLAHRRLPLRKPRVLTIAEVEALIAAGKSPLETAIAEFLYSTGVRVAELVAMRVEDVDFATGVARVKNGKGGKDRIVLFGSKAAAAIRKMLVFRFLDNRPKSGFLFEAPLRCGRIFKRKRYWYGAFHNKSKWLHETVTLGRIADLPTLTKARREFDRILTDTGLSAHPYTTTHIRRLISRMGIRAGIGRVYPHSLRRAFATHMLEHGADLRVIQDLLGHERVTTTAIYTSLSAGKLKEIHTRCHPTAEGSDRADEK
jgi:site-specific recombinase XerD